MEARQPSDEPVGFMDVVKLMWNRRSSRHLAFASGLTAFGAYSVLNWMASFMLRSHEISTGELGTWLAMIFGVGGAIGILLVTRFADKLAQHDKRWYVWIAAIASFLAVPTSVGIFTSDTATMALLFLVIPGALMTVFVPVGVAVIHSLVGLRMRATGSAILYLVINIVGLGGGPWSVGLLSDYLTPSLGTDSLGQAMLILIPIAFLWSGVHFVLAGRDLRADMERAPD